MSTSRHAGTRPGPWRSAVLAAAAIVLAVAACSSGATGGGIGGAAGAGSLTIAVDNGSPTLMDNFNPFSPNQRSGTPYMYEPLEYVNPLNGRYTPFLATGHTFTSNTTLDFTIRSGVRWSDGTPLTAADVVYTFDLMKQHAALDSAGVWQHLASVTSRGQTVVFTFSSPDVPFAQSIAQTLIVPEHVWSRVANPVTFTDTSPVVSGPYKLASFTPNQYVLTKNADCWQAGQAAPARLIFPALTGNQTSQLMLASGDFDWSTLFVPDIRQTWVSKDPANKYWFPPGGVISLYLNLAQAPFDSAAFRQALSAGLDRSSIAEKAEDGYVRPASQSGLLLPGLQSWLDPSLPARGVPGYQPQKAAALLAGAGYHKSGGKLTGPDGKQVTMTLITPDGFTDWLQGAQVIEQELGRLGIAAAIQTPQYAAYYSDLQSGHFDGAIGAFGGSGSPYLDLNALLSSSLTAPEGQPAASNFERYKNPAADRMLGALQATTSPAKQKRDTVALEHVMMTQIPVITLFYGATWGEYTTRAFGGWPDAADPYAPPAPYGSPPPDKSTPLMIITHLTRV